MQRLAILPALLLVVGPTLVHAQDQQLVRERYEEGLALAAAGDTAEALMRLRWVVRANPSWAAAQYQLGRLYARHASWIETDFHERRQAEKALREAIRLDPHNPAYVAEYGMLLHKQHKLNDSWRVLNRALDLLERRGADDDPELPTEIHLSLARIAEVRYEPYRDRQLEKPLGVTSLKDCDSPWIERCMERLLGSLTDVEDLGKDDLEDMVSHYWEAARGGSFHPDAARRLLLFLYDEHLYTDYLALARELARRYPDAPEGHLYLGLGLHALGHEEEAGSAFARGLSLLPSEVRAVFEDLEPVLQPKLARNYARFTQSQRQRFNELFLRIADPLYMTEVNERLLEHLARVVYVDLRFGAPAVGMRGWQTDPGVIFLRYGEPDGIVRSGTGRDSRQTVTWYYTEGLVFQFFQPTGYFYMRFDGDFEWRADEYRSFWAARYDDIPSIPRLIRIPIQLARFRGDSANEVSVEVHSELPLEELGEGTEMAEGELATYLFLMNIEGNEVVRHQRDEILNYDRPGSTNALRAWRLLIPAEGDLYVTVETRDASTWHAAVARDTFTSEFFGEDTLAISDVLLAEAMRPLAAEPARRRDLDIAVNPLLQYVPNQNVHVYYEVYGLQRDPEEFASYAVSLAVRVKSIAREGLSIFEALGQLADAWGFSAVGDDWIELTYDREVDMSGRDRAVEYLNFVLYRAPPGEYELRIKVWDRLADRLVSRRRAFTVVPEEPMASK